MSVCPRLGRNRAAGGEVRQNARQIVGDATPDCTRYTHRGPYLSGNDEHMFLYWSSSFEPNESGYPLVTTESGTGNYDPVGMSYNTLPANGAAPTGLSHQCTNHMPPATLGIDRATSIFWQVTNS